MICNNERDSIKTAIRAITAVLIALFLIPAGTSAGGWWRLYFTSPGRSAASAGVRNPEKGLVSIISAAEKYFYGAFYELSSPAVIRSLIGARKKGVEVKLVLEGDNIDAVTAGKMADAGIGIVRDTRRGLMHNKFAVIDGRYIWTGSYNPTVKGANNNNNNAVAIYSELLARIFYREFMEMYEGGIFGNRYETGPFADLFKRYYVNVEGTHINAYFSPDDTIESILLKRLKKAKESIHFMAFSFTSDALGEMIIQKHKQGLTVQGLFERDGVRSGYSEYLKMKAEGVPVKLDRNSDCMHHKVIIIDGYRVVTGSYNFSRNANVNNDENILIIDNREIAGEYLKEFYRLY